MATAAPTMSMEQGSRTGLPGEIEHVLRAFQGLHVVKKLFWELLGYDRRDEVVSVEGLGAALRSFVIEARLFASHDKFHLYYLMLTSESITLPIIRRLYRSFHRKHRFVALIIGNAGQTDWYLVYQPDGLSLAGTPNRLATLHLGHVEENLPRQAQALSRVKTYDDDDEPLSLLELATAYEEIFSRSIQQTKAPGRIIVGIERLLSEIGRYPLLTMRQEATILAEISELRDTIKVGEGKQTKSLRVADGDHYNRYYELRDMLVNQNLRLCFSIAKRYAINSDELLDLFQEAVIGLMRAIDHFDVNRKVRLSTYAYRTIQRSIVNWIRKHRYFFKLRSRIDQMKPGRLDEVKVFSLSNQDDVLSVDLIDNTTCLPGSNADGEVIRLALGLSLMSLSKRESNILIHHFGLYDSRKQTLEQIGEELGVSKERVRQIESRALERLRSTLMPLQKPWE